MTASDTLDQFMPIAIETLSSSERADFDLFFHPGRGRPLLFRSRSVPLADADLRRLAGAGVKTLLIGYGDRAAYEDHLHARVAADGELSLAGKYALARGSARTVFERAVGNQSTGRHGRGGRAVWRRDGQFAGR